VGAIQPFPKIVLLVDANKRLEEGLPRHVIPAQLIQFIAYRSGHSRTAEGSFEQVDICFYVLVFDGSKVDA
jgi:hypothetical protein